MRFIVAPDSFKGSLTSVEAGSTIRSAILVEMPDATVHVVPMADGGEGFVDALIFATGGRRIEQMATGPLGAAIPTGYGALGDQVTAAIEVAATAGLTLVPRESRDPFKTTTAGVGESILHALDHGFRKFIIGLGGSATNDGGLGMLQALGATFLDENRKAVPPFATSLSSIRTVDYTTLDPRLSESVIRGACDVDNPLCGTRGASHIYGPQKGATPTQVEQLDKAIAVYAGRVESHLNRSFQNIPGAGAAGGIGFALLTLGATLASGAHLVCEAAGMETLMTGVDWLITGEGKTDSQTLSGKVPFYLASMAARHRVPAILISGCMADDAGELHRLFRSMHSLVGGPVTVEKAMASAKPLLYDKTRNIIRRLKL